MRSVVVRSVFVTGLVLASGAVFAGIANAASAGKEPWWDDRAGGLVGSAMGIYGALFGTVVGGLGAAGRARGMVMGFMLITGVAGIVIAVLGVAALALGQPYGVWYPLILGGTVFCALSFGLMPSMRRRFAEEEMRRIDSQGIGGVSYT